MIPVEKLSVVHLTKLNQLYQENFYPDIKDVPVILFINQYLVSRVVADLQRYKEYQARLGSVWSPNSSLVIKNRFGELMVSFDPNFDLSLSSDQAVQAQQAAQSFQLAFLEYLAGGTS